MRLTWLADELRNAGLDVFEEPGWRDRGADWLPGRPYGAMQHHTAPPVPYPTHRLYDGGRIRANWQARPDGTVHVIAAGACNYSSGSGSSVVLAETKAGIAPTGTAKARGLSDTIGGNTYYINCEADHAGDGGPLPRLQELAIEIGWAVIFERLGWVPEKLITHAEWTRRKIDPYWNGRDAHTNGELLRHAIADTTDPGGGDDMRYWISLLQAQPDAFWPELQDKTGSPRGDAMYWSPSGDSQGRKATQAEWEAAVDELAAATLNAGVMSAHGVTQQP